MTIAVTEPRRTRPSGPLLELHDVTKTFGASHALEGVHFTLNPGEIHAIAGENGAGKSTFVKIVTGGYAADSGTIVVGGKRFDRLTPRQAQELGIAVVHQEFNLVPGLPVGENVFLGNLPTGRFRAVSRREWMDRTRELLARLNCTVDPRRPVGELSVAEQQMVEIAKALAVDARIIILDEPSTVLSNEELAALHGVLARLRDDGRGIVYISHRLDEVFRLADRVTVLKDGRHVSTCGTGELDQDELIRRMVGRPLVDLFPHRRARLGAPVLTAVGVTVPGKVFDISLTVHAGEIVGLAGLGGSGRTTLARALVGLERLGGGRVELGGVAAPRSPRACARAGLVMVPEDRKAHGILPGQSILANLVLPSLHRLRRLLLLSGKRETTLARRLVDEYDVRPPAPAAKVHQLSGGNQQKVVLARWLACQPKAVVLDEPTRGVDVGARAEIYARIERMSAGGIAVLLASSDLTELLGTCDRIVVLHEGRVSAELDRAEASEEAILRAATRTDRAAPPEPDQRSVQPAEKEGPWS